MKKIKIQLKKIFFFSAFFAGSNVFAADLIEVYRQAFVCDQTFRQVISQQLANKEGVPISFSNLLPSLNEVITPTLNRTTISGLNPFIGANTQRGYTANLTLTQTVFNFSQFANLAQALSLSKQADATINNAVQDLILRVARAYFNVLHAEDSLRYNQANKDSYAKQLDQVTQQFHVGLKTITDVYTARASYESSLASYIAAQTRLANEKENLRVITGVYYSNLSKLSERYPLVSPKPADIEAWVAVAERQNWAIKAAQYAADAACANVKQQFGGHIPTLQLQGFYNITQNNQIAKGGDVSGVPVSGSTRTNFYGGNLILNIPIVQGGYVVSATHQAQYQYQASYHALEQQVRATVNQTRQSYLNVLSGISQVHADRQAIISGKSSLEGLQAGYQVGTQTLVDVLNQQQRLFLAYQQYAQDRYAYINNLLALKYAAGTLSPCDLADINHWLYSSNIDYSYNTDSVIPDGDNDIDTHYIKSSRSKSSTRKQLANQQIQPTMNSKLKA